MPARRTWIDSSILGAAAERSPVFQRRPYPLHQGLAFEWLIQDRQNPLRQLASPRLTCPGRVAGEEDGGNLQTLGPLPCMQLQSAQSRQLDVRDQAVRPPSHGRAQECF